MFPDIESSRCVRDVHSSQRYPYSACSSRVSFVGAVGEEAARERQKT